MDHPLQESLVDSFEAVGTPGILRGVLAAVLVLVGAIGLMGIVDAAWPLAVFWSAMGLNWILAGVVCLRVARRRNALRHPRC